MTLREKEVPKMGVAIGVCTQTWWWYPDLTGDQVTQHLDANKAMLTAIDGVRTGFAHFSRSSVYANR